jgi:hypothetical protein
MLSIKGAPLEIGPAKQGLAELECWCQIETHKVTSSLSYCRLIASSSWPFRVATNRLLPAEPGVLMISNPIPTRTKRSYTTLRIPQSVLAGVHKRMTKV